MIRWLLNFLIPTKYINIEKKLFNKRDYFKKYYDGIDSLSVTTCYVSPDTKTVSNEMYVYTGMGEDGFPKVVFAEDVEWMEQSTGDEVI